MNTRTIIITIVLILAVLGIGYYFYHRSSGTPAPTPGGTVTPPFGTPSGNASSSPQGGAVMSVQSQNDEPVAVKDFINNGETIPDASNPGDYILQGSQGYCLPDGSCPVAGTNKDFSVSYSTKAQVFTVVLITEPIGQARREAETFLLDRLGVTQEQLCSLKYYVGTTYWINAAFDNRNLSFSFCPGAVALPN